MVTAKEIDRQLKNIGVNFWFFGVPELRELRHILVDGEVIDHCVLGRYEGGLAIVVATNLRLLLIDKKPFYLTLEDVRYDMIVEVDFARRLLDASIKICTPNKTLNFISFKRDELRLMTNYVQQRVMTARQQQMTPELRQYAQTQSQPQPQAQESWQRFIEVPMPRSTHSVKSIAQTAFDGASRVAEVHPISAVRQAINPYARSSFIMRQRISRF